MATHPITDRTDDDELRPMADAARFLGCSRAFVYVLVERGELERRHLGRAARIRVGDLRRLARTGTADDFANGAA